MSPKPKPVHYWPDWGILTYCGINTQRQSVWLTVAKDKVSCKNCLKAIK